MHFLPGETVFPNRTIPYCAPLAEGFKMIKGTYDTLCGRSAKRGFCGPDLLATEGGGERDLADARSKAVHCLVRERGLAFVCLSGAAGRPFALDAGESTRRQRCGKEILCAFCTKFCGLIWKHTCHICRVLHHLGKVN